MVDPELQRNLRRIPGQQHQREVLDLDLLDQHSGLCGLLVRCRLLVAGCRSAADRRAAEPAMSTPSSATRGTVLRESNGSQVRVEREMSDREQRRIAVIAAMAQHDPGALDAGDAPRARGSAPAVWAKSAAGGP